MVFYKINLHKLFLYKLCCGGRFQDVYLHILSSKGQKPLATTKYDFPIEDIYRISFSGAHDSSSFLQSTYRYTHYIVYNPSFLFHFSNRV